MQIQQIYDGPLRLYHLTQLREYCNQGLNEANKLAAIFNTQRGSENQFVFAQIQILFQFLKDEVGRAMVRDMMGETTMQQVIQPVTQQIDVSAIREEIHLKTLSLQQEIKASYDESLKNLNDRVQVTQDQVKKHTSTIHDLCNENKELKEEISQLEKVFQDQIGNFQSYIQEEGEKSKQILDAFKEEVINIIENEQPRHEPEPVQPNTEEMANADENFNEAPVENIEQEPLQEASTQQDEDSQNDEDQNYENQSQHSQHQEFQQNEEFEIINTNTNEEIAQILNVQVQPEEEKHLDTQMPILHQEVQLDKEYALAFGIESTFVCKSRNGTIFSGGLNGKIYILNNNSQQAIDIGERILFCITVNNLLYCGLRTQIVVIDCDTPLERIKTIQLEHGQENVAKMIQLSDNILLCIQNAYDSQCHIYIIPLNSNEIKTRQKVNFRIHDVIQTETQDELAFGTEYGLKFYKLNNDLSLEKIDEHLPGLSVSHVAQVSQDIFLIHIHWSQKLQFYDRIQKQTLNVIDIPGQTVFALQPLYLRLDQRPQRIVLMKDSKSINAIDTQNYSITKIKDLQCDGATHCSLFQEFDQAGNVNILSLGYSMSTRESKAVEFQLNRQFLL